MNYINKKLLFLVLVLLNNFYILPYFYYVVNNVGTNPIYTEHNNNGVFFKNYPKDRVPLHVLENNFNLRFLPYPLPLPGSIQITNVKVDVSKAKDNNIVFILSKNIY